MPIPIPPVWNPMGELKPLLTPMVPIPPMVGPTGKVEGIVPPCMGIVLVPEFKESLFRDVMFRRLLVRSFALNNKNQLNKY